MIENYATPRMPHTKRFRVIFSIWGHGHSDSVTDFDTLDEVKEECKLLREFYKDTPRPKKNKESTIISWDFSNGGSFWGYIVLDYEKEEVLENYKDGARFYVKFRDTWVPKIPTGILHIKDLAFRKEDEIPENYKWDVGEYEGWLKYRWGDGSNAIKPRPTKKILSGIPKTEEDDPQIKFDKEIEQEIKSRKLDRW